MSVKIKYMEKPDNCLECPFFRIVQDDAPVYVDNKPIIGASTKYRSCTFAEEYAEENIDGDEDDIQYFLDNTALHSDIDMIANKDYGPEEWCPIKEIEDEDIDNEC